MTRIRPLVVGLALVLWLPLTAAEFTVESAGDPPAEGVPDVIRSMVGAEGVRVKGPEGKVAAEYWPRSTPFTGEGASGFGIRFEKIPEGAFLGIVHFPEQGSDFREQTIRSGIYTMRYGLHPEDGNHMGVAPSRDFALLTPVAEDSDPQSNLGYAALVGMSLKAGNPHPTIVRVELPRGDQTPHLRQNDYEHWVVDLKVGNAIMGVVVYGHAEE